MKKIISIKLLRKQGFTLMEVIIALAISGIMFVTLGTFMLGMFKNVLRNQSEMDFLAIDRTGKLMLQREIRKGSDVFIDVINRDYMEIYHLDGSTRTIELQGENIISTDGSLGLNEYYIMGDVKDVIFTQTGDNDNAVNVYIEREQVVDNTANTVVQSTASFTVKLRNKYN